LKEHKHCSKRDEESRQVMIELAPLPVCQQLGLGVGRYRLSIHGHALVRPMSFMRRRLFGLRSNRRRERQHQNQKDLSHKFFLSHPPPTYPVEGFRSKLCFDCQLTGTGA
jgi:hypothetical protein